MRSRPGSGNTGSIWVEALGCPRISKQPRIEVFNPYSRSRYFVELTEARALIADGTGKWQGRRVILSDKSTATWAVKPSGEAVIYSEGEAFGPRLCTLQLV